MWFDNILKSSIMWLWRLSNPSTKNGSTLRSLSTVNLLPVTPHDEELPGNSTGVIDGLYSYANNYEGCEEPPSGDDLESTIVRTLMTIKMDVIK